MKAIVFDRFGDPADVLQVRDLPMPEPGPGQVRVRMIASPINPSDLLVVSGQYGRLPQLPAVPGFEGVGVVDAAGPGLLGFLRRGKRVAVLNGQGGNWQEFVVLPAKQVVPVASSIPDEQAAMFFVNPASAVVMTRSILKVPRGAWLLQTAAGSALGRIVENLGRIHGFRTINVVRRREQADELRKAGSEAVICSTDESIEERVLAITQGEGVRYALDAVGGATGSAAIKCLGTGGRLLVYGTLAAEPLSIDPRVLIVNHKTVAGFWLSNWVRQQGILSMLGLFRQLNRLFREGTVKTEIAATHRLDEIQAAVKRAASPARGGKVLLKIGN